MYSVLSALTEFTKTWMKSKTTKQTSCIQGVNWKKQLSFLIYEQFYRKNAKNTLLETNVEEQKPPKLNLLLL